MSKFKKTLLFFTPFHHIGRTADQLRSTAKNLKQSAEQLKEQQRRRGKQNQYEEGDVRNEQDPRKRFQMMYELHEWTEEDLRQQAAACRATRIACVVMSILSFIALLYIAPKLSVIWAIFLMPASGCLLLLCLAQSFRYALYEMQLQERSFVGWKELAGRRDLFLRLFFR